MEETRIIYFWQVVLELHEQFSRMVLYCLLVLLAACGGAELQAGVPEQKV